MISAKDRLFRFFTENIPPAGSLTIRYRPAVPVITRVTEPASIKALAALESGDGVIEYAPPPDPSLDSLEAARAAGKADLREHAYPMITASYRTFGHGLRPGMLQRIATRGLNQDLVVRSVSASEIGIGTDGKMVMQYGVEAGSKLLGVEDYLLSLTRQGKRISRTGAEQIDIFNSPDDQAVASDSATITTSAEGVGYAKVGTAKVGSCIVG
ncbi:hypothetical protein D3C86_1505080 [compost metagenome]